MLVPVAVVQRVAVAVMDVVDVVAMWHSFMAAIRAVLVIAVVFVNNMLGWNALVPVSVMFTMGMAIVDVVDVVTVGHGFVAAVRSVLV